MAKKRQESDTVESPIADNELSMDHKAADEFCSSVTTDDISFETWCRHHSELDLIFPLFVSKDDLESCTKVTVRLSRTIKFLSGATMTTKREKFECEVALQPLHLQTPCLMFEGLGDRDGQRFGNLKIMLHFKD